MTAYEMRISDWSSDVWSSDLFQRVRIVAGGGGHRLYRFEFVAAHEVGSADEFANALAHWTWPRLDRGCHRPVACRRRDLRSEKSRVGKECVSTCKSGRDPDT